MGQDTVNPFVSETFNNPLVRSFRECHCPDFVQHVCTQQNFSFSLSFSLFKGRTKGTLVLSVETTATSTRPHGLEIIQQLQDVPVVFTFPCLYFSFFLGVYAANPHLQKVNCIPIPSRNSVVIILPVTGNCGKAVEKSEFR